MTFISNTQDDRLQMLKSIGIPDGDVEKLFKDIPENLRIRSLRIPSASSEYEVTRHIKALANKNNHEFTSFLGAGYYNHFIPAAIDALISRSEFYTAYTPYQPEASQGTLQAIYEYQSAISRLCGMEVANASLYDGATALFEAAMMAMRITGKNRIIVDSGLNPIHKKILYGYTTNLSVEFMETPVNGCRADKNKIKDLLDDKTAAVILQNPNFFGTIDDFSDVIKNCKSFGAVVIMSVYPVSLGILKTPGEMGADIVIGEGQSLGIPLSFGGPYLGFMAAKKEHVRKMPGRIVGATTDSDNKRGFVLTLQTREQHIRREKATSNICTNVALCAIQSLIFMCLLGREGLKALAQLNLEKAEFARQALEKIKGVQVKRNAPTFNEFTVCLPQEAKKVVAAMIKKGFAAGFPLGRYYKGMDNYLTVAVTEKRTKEEIVRFAESLEGVLWN